jgi:hypothetical protein
MITINVTENPGQCRWCGCTDDRGCTCGCGWANAAHTLCTACVNFDRLIRTRRGRVELLDKVQDAL